MLYYHEIKAIKEQVLNVNADNLEYYLEKKRKGGETLDYMDEIQELVQLVSTLDFSIKEMKNQFEKIVTHCFTVEEQSEIKDREKEENAYNSQQLRQIQGLYSDIQQRYDEQQQRYYVSEQRNDEVIRQQQEKINKYEQIVQDIQQEQLKSNIMQFQQEFQEKNKKIATENEDLKSQNKQLQKDQTYLNTCVRQLTDENQEIKNFYETQLAQITSKQSPQNTNEEVNNTAAEKQKVTYLPRAHGESFQKRRQDKKYQSFTIDVNAQDNQRYSPRQRLNTDDNNQQLDESLKNFSEFYDQKFIYQGDVVDTKSVCTQTQEVQLSQEDQAEEEDELIQYETSNSSKSSRYDDSYPFRDRKDKQKQYYVGKILENFYFKQSFFLIFLNIFILIIELIIFLLILPMHLGCIVNLNWKKVFQREKKRISSQIVL